jgi:DNA-binding MarR family transcriptional regulator
MNSGEPVYVLSEDEINSLAKSMMFTWQSATRDIGKGTVLDGLQLSQFVVLRFLRRGPMRMSQLAELTGTSSANVTGMVDRLVQRGVVTRVNDTKDRRVVLVSLTPAGQALFTEQGSLFKKHVRRLLAPLEPEERHEFVRLMAKIYDAGTAESD